MIERSNFVIDGKNVEIQQFGAVQGWKLLRKLTAIVGPAMGKGANDYGAAIDTLFMRLPENELIALLKKLTQFVWIDDRPVNFETDMLVGSFSVKVVTEVLKLNFEEFFLTIKEQFQGLIQEVIEETE
tara:strand:+ start:5738 stop:6121 length:384 start_codon:yes stop_codon:yes gene_type:complete